MLYAPTLRRTKQSFVSLSVCVCHHAMLYLRRVCIANPVSHTPVLPPYLVLTPHVLSCSLTLCCIKSCRPVFFVVLVVTPLTAKATTRDATSPRPNPAPSSTLFPSRTDLGVGALERALESSFRARSYSLFSDSSLTAASQISSEFGFAWKAIERIERAAGTSFCGERG